MPKASIKKVLRFLVSGGSAALVEYLVFLVLHHVHVDLVIANTLSFMSGFVVSFLLNKFWVFSNQESMKGQLLKYSILALVNVLISNGVVWLMVNELGVVPFIAKVITMVAIASWNYIIFSKIVFKNREQ